MEKRICRAIKKQKILEFQYDGFDRVVEPYCHGWRDDGSEYLRGFQIAGGSDSGGIPAWRLFKIEKIHELRITTTAFSADRSDYAPDDPILTVHCSI